MNLNLRRRTTPDRLARRIGRRLRRLATVAALVGAVAGANVVLSAQPSQALSSPNALLSCSAGYVSTSAPTVYGEQQRWAFRWEPVLYRYVPGTGWRLVVAGPLLWATPAGSDFSVGTSYGWAGPTWYGSSGAAYTRYTWRVTPGYYYAILNYTTDTNPQFNTGWVSAYATTGYYGTGATSCRA
jgi:hypothetical protein